MDAGCYALLCGLLIVFSLKGTKFIGDQDNACMPGIIAYEATETKMV